jgi:transposase
MRQHGANQRTAFGVDADGKLAGYFSLPPLGELAFYNPQLHSWIGALPERKPRNRPFQRSQPTTRDENVNENLTPRMRNLVAMLWSEWKDLELQIVQMNDEVERIASSDATCRRLLQIPGIGPLVATAIVASIGNGAAFRKGREFAAWMGLLPKQHSTGGKARLYGISKRGNSYLRKILIHGARAVRIAIRAGPYRDGRLDDLA